MAAAKTKINVASLYIHKSAVKRAGVHSKSKTSKNKRSKNYKKTYRGQGK